MSGAPDTVDLALRRAWSSPGGLTGFLGDAGHRAVGARFMITAFAFFLAGSLEALLVRAQLARPQNDLVSPETFHQLVTVHGSTMLFLFVVPFLQGLSLHVVPLMIGTREVAFPRLAAFAYWLYLIAGVSLHLALLAGVAPAAGWDNVTPLSGSAFSPGPGVDVWLSSTVLVALSTLAVAVDVVVTVARQRAPGMALHRVPIFVWGALVAALMMIFAMPPLIVASLMLGLDRLAGTCFFALAAGGDPLLWQQLFWFFAQPCAGAVLVSAFGIVSAIVSTSARRPLAGYRVVTGALVLIGLFSFGLWVQHVSLGGGPRPGASLFAALGMILSVPIGLVLACWIYTIARGRPRFDTASLFVLGMIVTFVVGCATSVMLASGPFRREVQGTLFVVAHLHYVLIGGVLFPILAAAYFWFPKVFGRMPGERLGVGSFWILSIGFHGAFLPLLVAGACGMPRRAYTYSAGVGGAELQLFATASAFVMGLGILLSVANLVWAAFAGPPASADPWRGPTLEWATGSPPPPFAFRRIPIVRSAHPLWRAAGQGEARATDIGGLDDGRREVLSTSVVGAMPLHRQALPGPSMWPLWLALGVAVAVVGARIHLGCVPLGAGLAAVALLGWHWPSAPTRGPSSIEWGVALVIVIEAVAVLALITSYLYVAVTRGGELAHQPGPPLDPTLSALALALAVLSLGPMHLAARASRTSLVRAALGIAALIGVGSLILEILGLLRLGPLWTSHAYGSFVWILGAQHALRIGVVLSVAAGVLGFSHVRRVDGARRAPVRALRAYWSFAVAVGALTFFTVHLSPGLM